MKITKVKQDTWLVRPHKWMNFLTEYQKKTSQCKFKRTQFHSCFDKASRLSLWEYLEKGVNLQGCRVVAITKINQKA